jgi:hypothetical protein
VRGSGFRVKDEGFLLSRGGLLKRLWVWGLGFRVYGLGLVIRVFGFWVQISGSRVSGSGLIIKVLRLRV